MRAAPCLAAALLAACASAPPPAATLVQEGSVATVVAGRSSRATVQAALGATQVQSFDSGYQVWLYQLPRPGGRYAEFVILFGPDGVVRKTRLREPVQ
jgi:hypothetical protein